MYLNSLMEKLISARDAIIKNCIALDSCGNQDNVQTTKIINWCDLITKSIESIATAETSKSMNDALNGSLHSLCLINNSICHTIEKYDDEGRNLGTIDNKEAKNIFLLVNRKYDLCQDIKRYIDN